MVTTEELSPHEIDVVEAVEGLLASQPDTLAASAIVLRLVAGCMRRAVADKPPLSQADHQLVAAYLQVVDCASFCDASSSIMSAAKKMEGK